MPDTNKVDTPSIGYLAMQEKWGMLHDLLGGTDTMRAASTKWLPKEEAEADDTYAVRLARSVLYNALADTVEKLVSKPFANTVTIRGELPENLESLEDNADYAGTDLTQFARDVFEAGVQYGLTHILVDFPKLGPLTLAQERETGVRPSFIHIKPTQLIGWESVISPTGKRILTQIRIAEERTEPDGKYGQTTRSYIRVYTPDTFELWAEDTDTNEWFLEEEGTHTFGEIPLVTFYIQKVSHLVGTPPLEDLAHLNIAHWQSDSDQRNILRFARSGLLLITGVTEGEVPQVVIGPNQVLALTATDADMKYVEHTGKAIESGEHDLTKLEERMEVLGLQPLIQRTSMSTATGKVLDEARTQSNIQAWIHSLENALLTAFKFAAKWMDETLADDFSVDIFSDFSLSFKSNDDAKLLLEARLSGEISRELFLTEYKRRGMFSDAVVVEEEIERIESDLMTMAAMDNEFDNTDHSGNTDGDQ